MASLFRLDVAYSSEFIPTTIAALSALVVLLYYVGVVSWIFRLVGFLIRKSVQFGFAQWKRWISWANWWVFLILVLSFPAGGIEFVTVYPALAVLLGSLAMFLGMTTCLAYIHLDLERYEVERGYKALHNPLKGQELARDLAHYAHQVGVHYLAAAAVSTVGGFALLNQGLCWSIGGSWYYQELGNASY